MHGERRGLADEDWASLVLSIRSGRCVLMVGPGVNLQYDGDRVPVLEALADHLAAESGDDDLAGPSPATWRPPASHRDPDAGRLR